MRNDFEHFLDAILLTNKRPKIQYRPVWNAEQELEKWWEDCILGLLSRTQIGGLELSHGFQKSYYLQPATVSFFGLLCDHAHVETSMPENLLEG